MEAKKNLQADADRILDYRLGAAKWYSTSISFLRLQCFMNLTLQDGISSQAVNMQTRTTGRECDA
jgi:hypothetical protein